jgi:DNA-binding NarL/FixJ family response regulator
MPIPNPQAISILLVDSQTLVRTGVRLLLEREPGFTVVGEASSHEEALEAVRMRPDVILFNLHHETESYLNFLSDLLTIAEDARLLVLIDNFNLDFRHRVVRLGVKGMVQKTDTPDLLVSAVKKVHAGEVWLDPKTIAHVLDEYLYSREAKRSNVGGGRGIKFTRRERDVIALIGSGLKNKQIAERLCISEPTVRHYLTSIFEKIRVTDRFGLIVYAYQHGLANPPFLTDLSQRESDGNGHKKNSSRNSNLDRSPAKPDGRSG